MDTRKRRPALKPLLEEPPAETVPDWRNIALFAGGVTLGIVLGAGAALLLAPASGSEVRERISKRIRGEDDSDSAWDVLALELERAEKDLADAEEKLAGR